MNISTIYSTKEEALINLNCSTVIAGEIRVLRYYTSNGDLDSFIIIGVQDGIGPDCYQILSKRKNLIVNVGTEYADIAANLIQGQTWVCPVNGIYHMLYLDGAERVDREIKQGESFYVEDFDSGYMYYLDRYTCKKLDDYHSKIYIALSNSRAIYKEGSYPETSVTVWRDNSNITKACDISVTSEGCTAIYNSSGVVRVIGMDSDTATVTVKAIYDGNQYTETWNISKVIEGAAGADAETWTIYPGTTVVRYPDLLSTEVTAFYRSGTDLSYIEVNRLQEYGLELIYTYSNGVTGKITTSPFEFQWDGMETITSCTLVLRTIVDQEELHTVTLPYMPDVASYTEAQGVYKSIVFCRTNQTPETPTGGTWNSPVPTSTLWEQSVPESTDNEVIWISTRIFTSDGEEPQEDTWSTPSKLSSTKGLEVMYSTCTDPTIVGTPTTKPELWEETLTGEAYFMATRTITNGVYGLWQVFSIHGKDGEKPNYKNYIYYNSETKPSQPTGNNPVGWVDYPETDGVWWMSCAEFSGETGTILGSWSYPIKVSGADGEKGSDGSWMAYQYSVSASPTSAPSYNWSTTVPTVNTGMYLWYRTGTVIPPATKPEHWSTPIRVTGEKGEAGATGRSIKIDLTNEVSSVAADYEGNVPSGATFETSQVLLYENTDPIAWGSSRITSIKLVTDGVTASISRTGLITVTDWTHPNDRSTATVEVIIVLDGNSYSTTYTIQKIKSGVPGQSAVTYSILPSNNLIRKVGTRLDPESITASVVRSQGGLQETVGNLSDSGLSLMYSVNNGDPEVYRGSIAITTNTYLVQFTLSDASSGDILDKETVLVLESGVNLQVDLTNELTAVACDSVTGKVYPTATWETSMVQIYYGGVAVPVTDGVTMTAAWTNVTGTFDTTTGTIRPTAWDPDHILADTGMVELTVTYKEYTKTVIYTIKKIKGGINGETPTIYSLIPSISSIRASSTQMSVSTLRTDLSKTVGSDRKVLTTSTQFTESKVIVKYIKEYSNGTSDPEATYDSTAGITVAPGSNLAQVVLIAYDITDILAPVILDKETIPVIYNGEGLNFIDLSNQTDAILCNPNGEPYSESDTNPWPSTIATYYEGNTKTSTKFTVSCTDCSVKFGATSGTATTTVTSGRSETTVNALESLYIKVTGIQSDRARVTIKNADDLLVSEKDMTLVKSKQAKTEKYNIIPSATTIRKNTSGAYTPVTLSVQISRMDGSSTVDCTTLSTGQIQYYDSKQGSTVTTGYFLYYRTSGGTGWYPVAIGSTVLKPGETIGFTDYIDFVITNTSGYSGGTTGIIDRETVNVVSDGINGTVPNWKSYIFCNSATIPETPRFAGHPSTSPSSQGSYLWYDGPDGTDGAWWMSCATIDGSSSTNALLTGTAWSTPIKVTGVNGENGSSIRVSYQNSVNLNTPPTGTWSDTPTAPSSGQYTWMRIETLDKDGSVTSTKYSRVTGEKGESGGLSIEDELSYLGNDATKKGYNSGYTIIGDNTYDADSTTSYSGILYKPDKSSVPVDSVLNGDCYTYKGKLVICTGRTSTVNTWVISDIKGEPGDETALYVAYATDYNGTSGATGFSTTWTSGCKWIGMAALNKSEYPNQPGSDSESLYTWSKFVGSDGPGQEFVYIRTDSQTDVPYDISELPEFHSDEYIPGDTNSSIAGTAGVWTDNPMGTEDSDGKRVEWVSTRHKSANGSWGKFSKPSVFAVDNIDNLKEWTGTEQPDDTSPDTSPKFNGTIWAKAGHIGKYDKDTPANDYSWIINDYGLYRMSRDADVTQSETKFCRTKREFEVVGTKAVSVGADNYNATGIVMTRSKEKYDTSTAAASATDCLETTVEGRIIIDSEKGITATTGVVKVFSLDMAGNAYFSGEIQSGSGSIGGWTLDSDSLYSGSGGTYVGLSSDPSENYAMWAGHSAGASAGFSVKKDGTVFASSGTIGGWWLGSNNLTAGSNSSYVEINSDNSESYAMWAGGTTKTTAPFSVKKNGEIYASSGTIGGWCLNEEYLRTSGGPTSATDTTEGIYIGKTGIQAYKDSSHYVRLTSDGILRAVGVDVSGEITASSGEIGGWDLSDHIIYHKNTADDSIIEAQIVSSGISYSVKIDDLMTEARDDWRITVGTKFGVDKDGILYCKGGHFSGEIESTSGTIGGWKIGAGGIYTENPFYYSSDVDPNYAYSGYIGLSSNEILLYKSYTDVGGFSGTEYTPGVGADIKYKGIISINSNGVGVGAFVIDDPTTTNTIPSDFKNWIQSDGSGWLASGNLSWDTNGNIYGPKIEDPDNWLGHGWTLDNTGGAEFWSTVNIMSYRNGTAGEINSEEGVYLSGQNINIRTYGTTGLRELLLTNEYIKMSRKDTTYPSGQEFTVERELWLFTEKGIEISLKEGEGKKKTTTYGLEFIGTESEWESETNKNIFTKVYII